jgi:hypothetical protein
MKLGLPDSGPLVDANGNLTKTGLAFMSSVADFISLRFGAGPTTERPTEQLEIGVTQFYDTTVGKMLWVKSVKPTVWMDALGTVVP